MIAKLRVWLLEIVREAIRLEFPRQQQIPPTGFYPLDGALGAMKPVKTPLKALTPEPSEKSFEQLQDESLQAQEKFYADLKPPASM